MYIPEYKYKTIKEAQQEILYSIFIEGREIENTFEINNVSLCITNPLLIDREYSLNSTLISEKHMDQMLLKPNPKLEKTHYDRLHSFGIKGYGSYDQIEEVISRLKENPFSKRCVLTLWHPEDVSDEYALSWTMTQLMIRDNKLIFTNFFRGCDIWNAFPFNMLGVAQLQKEITDRLGIETGEFIVHIGSAHIYKVHIKSITEYLANI
jgi:thymidylate synthase